jgi:hypothetical protein
LFVGCYYIGSLLGLLLGVLCFIVGVTIPINRLINNAGVVNVRLYNSIGELWYKGINLYFRFNNVFVDLIWKYKYNLVALYYVGFFRIIFILVDLLLDGLCVCSSCMIVWLLLVDCHFFLFFVINVYCFGLISLLIVYFNFVIIYNNNNLLTSGLLLIVVYCLLIVDYSYFFVICLSLIVNGGRLVYNTVMLFVKLYNFVVMFITGTNHIIIGSVYIVVGIIGGL